MLRFVKSEKECLLDFGKRFVGWVEIVLFDLLVFSWR